MTNQTQPGRLESLLGRIPVSRRSQLAWAVVLLLGAVVMLPRLGDDGLWDPWEMRWAHMARTMAEPARILVLEAPDSSAGMAAYPLAKATADAFSDSAQVDSSERYLSERQATDDGADPRGVAQQLLHVLEQRVYHGLVVDSALFVRSGSETKDFAKLADALDNIAHKNPKMAVVVVGHVPDLSAFRKNLEDGWNAVREERVVAQNKAEQGDLRKPPSKSKEIETIRIETAVDWNQLSVVSAKDMKVFEAEITVALAEVPGSQWWQATFKEDGQTRAVPLLDRWLVAVNYRWFGVHEATTRLPFALLGVAGVLLLYGIGRMWFGPSAAMWAVVVAVTLPLYFGQARNAAGELTTTVGMLGAVGSLGAAILGKRPIWVILSLIFFSVLLFLAKGLFGLLALALIAVAYVLVTLDLRKQVLVPTLVLLGLFAALVAVVLGSDSSGIWNHFRFMTKLFGDGPPKEWRNFDYFLRQIGFGVYPWSVFLPFAVGRLCLASKSAWSSEETSPQDVSASRLQILVLLYFAVPLVQWMFGIHEFSHLVYPAVPAVALATGVFLNRLSHGLVLDRFAAFVGFGMLAMLFNDIRHSADTLFSFLTTDPPFARDEKQGMVFPSELKIGLWFSLGTAIVVAMVGLMFGRLTETVSRIARFVRRPAVAMSLISLTIAGIIARVVLGLADRVGDRFQLPAVMRAFEQGQQFFVSQALVRPEVIIGLILVAILAVGGPLALTQRGRTWTGKLPNAIRIFGRAVGFVLRFLRTDKLVGQAFGMVVVGIAGIVLAFVRLRIPAGYGIGTTLADPIVYGLLVVAVGLGIVARQEGPGVAGRVGNLMRQLGPAWAAPLLGVGLLCGYLALRFPKELWQYAPETWGVVSLLGVLVAQFAFSVGRRRFWALFAIAGAVYLGVAVSVWVPLAAKLADVNAVAPPDGGDDTYVYLFMKSRATLGLLGMVILLVLNWKVSTVKVLDRVATWIQRLSYRVEDSSVALPTLAVAALLITLTYNLSIVPALSFHVSQKHIIDTYHEAEGALSDGSNLFKHGSFAKTNNDFNFNFYTNRVTEIGDRSRMLDVLLRQQDTVVKTTAAGGREKTELLPGWNAKNDTNGDGVRDWLADSGLAEEVGEGRLVDVDKKWSPNQWVGYHVFDNSLDSFEILSNDATSLTLSGKPVLGGIANLGNRYIIDHPEASVHDATAQHMGRNFFILPKRNFSELNYQFRKKASGRHIPVLDDRSSQLILATGHLVAGEENRNWLAMHVTSEAEALKIPGFRSAYVNFEDKIALLGYTVEEESVKRREEVKLRIYFKALTEIDASYKIFMHIDKAGSSNRIHSDHYVLNESKDSEEKNCVGCFQTNHWMPGDVVIDPYTREIPLGTPSGAQDMWMGFYNTTNDARLKVKDFDKKKVVHDGQNRVKMGSFMVR